MKINKDLEYIKNFSAIKITDICRKLKVNRQNVLNGRASKDNIKLVRKEIEKEIDKINL